MPTRRTAIGCLLAAVLACAQAWAADGLREEEIKAAFAFNFIQFTEWPPKHLETSKSLNLCVRSGGPVANELASLVGRDVHGRPLALNRLPPDSLAGCHVVLVDAKDAGWLAQMHAELGRAPVLLMADDDRNEIPGVMITLAASGRKVVFDVDVARVRGAGLTVSSRVLRLARAVR